MIADRSDLERRGFVRWRELEGGERFERPEPFERVLVASPTLWWLREGWKHGGSISVLTIPG